MLKIINFFRAANYLPWCGISFASNCQEWTGSEAGKHTQSSRKGIKRGAAFLEQERNHFDTNNTLPLISLITSFLLLNVCYSGKSAAVVFCWKGMRVVQRRQLSTYTYFCPLVIWIRFRYHFHLWTKKASERKKALEKWCFMQGDVAHENYITTTPKSIFSLLMQINLSRWPWAFENLEIVCRCCDKWSGKMVVAMTASCLPEHKHSNNMTASHFHAGATETFKCPLS